MLLLWSRSSLAPSIEILSCHGCYVLEPHPRLTAEDFGHYRHYLWRRRRQQRPRSRGWCWFPPSSERWKTSRLPYWPPEVSQRPQRRSRYPGCLQVRRRRSERCQNYWHYFPPPPGFVFVPRLPQGTPGSLGTASRSSRRANPWGSCGRLFPCRRPRVPSDSAPLSFREWSSSKGYRPGRCYFPCFWQENSKKKKAKKSGFLCQ